jgi:hypothetical protein
MTLLVRFVNARSHCRSAIFYSVAIAIELMSRVIPHFRYWLEEQLWLRSLHPADRMVARTRVSDSEGFDTSKAIRRRHGADIS